MAQKIQKGFEERKTFRHISQENDERIRCRNGAISLETNRRIKSNFATSALFYTHTIKSISTTRCHKSSIRIKHIVMQQQHKHLTKYVHIKTHIRVRLHSYAIHAFNFPTPCANFPMIYKRCSHMKKKSINYAANLKLDNLILSYSLSQKLENIIFNFLERNMQNMYLYHQNCLYAQILSC